MSNSTLAMLERAGNRIASVHKSKNFIATRLLAWSGGESINFDAVARFLHCEREPAVKLALCKVPRDRADVARIANYLGVSKALLYILLGPHEAQEGDCPSCGAPNDIECPCSDEEVARAIKRREAEARRQD